jgi:hypothetical protein
MNGLRKCDTNIELNIIHPKRRMKLCFQVTIKPVEIVLRRGGMRENIGGDESN